MRELKRHALFLGTLAAIAVIACSAYDRVTHEFTIGLLRRGLLVSATTTVWLSSVAYYSLKKWRNTARE